MNLSKILKNKISTPVAIGTAILAALLVGGFLVWQTGLGAIRIQEKKERPFSSDKYIFLDQHTHIYGEILEKKEGAICGGRMIDFPTYSFDSERKVLGGLMDFDVSKELKIIYGSGLSLSGDAGGGAATDLTGVYDVPYNAEDIVINEVNNDGTIYFTYKGKEIDLKPDDSWEEAKVEVTEGDGCKMKTTITDKIVNYGILEKDKIQLWSK